MYRGNLGVIGVIFRDMENRRGRIACLKNSLCFSFHWMAGLWRINLRLSITVHTQLQTHPNIPPPFSFLQLIHTQLAFGFIPTPGILPFPRLHFSCKRVTPQGADTHPPSTTRGKAGRNHLYEDITPLLPTGIGERYSQTISNLGHAALLRRCELPL